IQSGDERVGGIYIRDLTPQYPGTPATGDNGCYDFRAEPPLGSVNDNDGTFNRDHNATVGICPPAAAFALDHGTLDQIQIIRFDELGEGSNTLALVNVPAPFLRCDPHFSPSFG